MRIENTDLNITYFLSLFETSITFWSAHTILRFVAPRESVNVPSKNVPSLG